MIRVMIGYDPNEVVAYHVLAHSILRHASEPVSVTPLKLSQLPLKRARHPQQSTEFAFSRFLVPWLCRWEGRAIFMDCDMLCRSDIAELWQLPQQGAVDVVQHDYEPKDGTKFLGQSQAVYKKKNWSSLMVFDNAQCRLLQPETVDTVDGLYLHQFKWAETVGSLPVEWNHLVGEYDPNPRAKIAHFTLGGPWFKGCRDVEFSDEWRIEWDKMLTHADSVPLKAVA